MGRAKWQPKTKPRFKVGDWVYWISGESRHLARVTQVRNPVGDDEVWMYGLREYQLWTDVMDYSLTENYLEPAPKPTELPEPHDKLPVP